ncbi:MAG: molecular chaperone TorD family protein [Desulfohalobiaceae bacterium]|nr:molecular chaperone TorD family protein [Desulfohalobiaceae bacterium]
MDSQAICTLGRLFAYPREKPGKEDLARLGGCGKRLIPMLEQTDLLGLQEEYVRLFINSLPETPCPPYGSFYLEGTLMGRTTLKLKNLHLEYGLESDELADHVAAELEFLGLLTRLREEAEQVEEDQAEVRDHLKRWLPAFIKRVEEHDSTGFYRSLSRCLQQIEF